MGAFFFLTSAQAAQGQGPLCRWGNRFSKATLHTPLLALLAWPHNLQDDLLVLILLMRTPEIPGSEGHGWGPTSEPQRSLFHQHFYPTPSTLHNT